jgi:hypothetical protein
LSRRLVFLLAAVALLAAVLLMWDLPRQREAEEEAREAAVLLPTEAALVDTLRLRRPDGVVEAARRGDGWVLLRPIAEPANPGAVEGLLRVFTRAERGRTVATDVDTTALDAFGLGGLRRPDFSVELIGARSRPEILWIGRTNPGGTSAYVRRAGEDVVVLVDKSVRDAALTEYHALRIFDLFAVETEEVDRIAVTWRGGAWAAAKDSMGLWFEEGGTGRQLRRRLLRTVAYDLASARVRRYVADGMAEADFAGYGLHDPLLDLRFDARGEAHRLRLGNEIEENEHYARRDGAATLLVVSSQLLQSCEMRLGEMLETNPVPFNYDRLDSVRITWHSGEQATCLPVGRGQWRMRPPPGWTGAPDRFDVSVQNVRYGIEELSSDAAVELSSADAFDDFVDEKKVRVDLFWPERTVRYWLGWRRGEDAHWIHVVGTTRAHRIPRDLFFRLRGLLLTAEMIDPRS